MMKKKNPLKPALSVALLLLLGIVNIVPAQAGDPDHTVGPPDPTKLVCVEKDTHEWVDLDSDAFDPDGTYNPDADVDPDEIEKECKRTEEDRRSEGDDVELTTEYIRLTRIEGYVFEFHRDPNGPGGWTAVRSRDVMVVASGPGFEIFWGSEKDGFYYFDFLGSGPITLNLRLPPDANPNITVMSRGFDEVWKVDLAFHRGDIPPEDVDALRLPSDHPRSRLIPGDTIIAIDEETGQFVFLPDVGGVLLQDTSVVIIVLAAIVLVLLPAAGILKLRRKRIEP